MADHQALREKVQARNRKQKHHALSLKRRTKIKSLLAGLAAAEKRRSARKRVAGQVAVSRFKAMQAKKRAARSADRNRHRV